MKRLPFILFPVLFIAALSFAFVGCKSKEATKPRHKEENKEKILVSDLHPCEVTGTQLTEEDCKAARYWLDKAKKGTAAVGVPTWMLQGQTKIVTLAVGTMPPPEVPANRQSKPEPPRSSEPLSESPSKPEPAPDSTSTYEPQPKPTHPVETPHDVVKKAGGSKKQEIIDYYPFVGRRMSAELHGEGFKIKPLFDRSDQPLVDNAVTTWEWKITAKDYGKKTLILKTNVVMINSRGEPEPLEPTTEYREIVVYIGVDGIFNGIKSLPDWLKVIAAILMGVSAVAGAWKSLKAQSGHRGSRRKGQPLTVGKKIKRIAQQSNPADRAQGPGK
jgi:hypothetical protein